MQDKIKQGVLAISHIFEVVHNTKLELSYWCKELEGIMLYLGYKIETQDVYYYSNPENAYAFAHDVITMLAFKDSEKEQ